MQNMTFQWDSRYVYYSSSSASCPSIISVRKYYQETDMRGNYLPLCHLHFSSICHFSPFQIRIYPVNFISSSPGSLFLVLHCLNFPEDSQSPPNIGVTRINRGQIYKRQCIIPTKLSRGCHIKNTAGALCFSMKIKSRCFRNQIEKKNHPNLILNSYRL